MKKQLLFAIAIIASTFTSVAYAQGTFAVDTLVTYTGGQTITSVSGVTLTLGNDTYTTKPEKSKISGFIGYISGAANPIDASGLGFDKGGALPTKGCYYVFTPTIDGTLSIAVVLSATKPFYIIEDGTAMSNYNGHLETAKYYGTYSFPVKANSTYYVFCTGSKLGFYGFSFTGTNPSSINNVSKNIIKTDYYNITGIKLAQLQSGINIIKNTYEDGTVKFSKIIK